MSTFEQISSPIGVARVRAIEDDGHLLHLEFRNGQLHFITGEEPFEFAIGSLVRVEPGEFNIEAAPDALWPEESWVGIVRLKLPDTTLVDISGRLKMVPTRSDVEYLEGSTVEGRDTQGIIRVLSKEPLKFLDFRAIDDADIDKLKVKKEVNKETFDDFGGLQEVVAQVRELIEAPIKYKDSLSKMNAPQIKGILFTGAPGTGKTMLARIIANTTESQFYEISGPELLSKWYGQSEEMLRKLFDDAAKQTQSIIFFDEIDSIASQRSEESHEVSRRVVSQLLTLMDGFKSYNNIIVIAATNRPQDIDMALRRPGRFDLEINFRLPALHDRELILRSYARRRSSSNNLPHALIAQNTEAWSAPELAAIWREAARLATTDGRSEIIAEDYIGGFEQISGQRRRVKRTSPGGKSN